MSRCLDAALQYAGHGFPVFPVGVDKSPLSPHGFKDATVDRAVITDWWTRWPDAGIGVPTGGITDTYVVDIDARHDGLQSLAKLIEKHGELPDGPIGNTGGGGLHIWFLHPGGEIPNTAHVMPGIDTRGDGGYVVVPPSPHMSGKEYAWQRPLFGTKLPMLPVWLFKLVYDRTPPDSGVRGPRPEVQASTPDDLEILRRIYAGPNGRLHRSVYENHLSVEHTKDHAAYVGFCTALYFAGATEDQVPRILRFDPASWAKSGRAQWRHLVSKGGYYRRHDSLVAASVLYEEADKTIAKASGPPTPPKGAPPTASPIPRDLFVRKEKKDGSVSMEPDLERFLWWLRTAEHFAVPIERGTFATPANFQILHYDTGAGYYNGKARRYIRARTDDAFRKESLAARDAFREEVVRGVANTSEFHKDRSTFNPPELLCLKNGIVPVDGATPVAPHTPDIIFTWSLPVAYDQYAACPRFERFLQEIMPDTEDGTGQKKRDLIVDLLGYLLWRRNPFQQFFVFVGDGANGKTTLGKVIQALLGEEAMSGLSLQQVSSHRFAPAELEGKLVNLCDDLPYDKPLAATGALKVLTGEGTLTVERKNQHPFQLRFDGKLVSMANRTPPTEDDTYAFWRRAVVIPLEQTFPVGDPRRDPHLEEKLRAELPGILNLALRGLKRVRTRLEFDPDKMFADAQEEWQRRADPVRAELLEAFEAKVGAFVTNQEIREYHVTQSQQEGREPLNDRAFGDAIKRAFPLSQAKQQRVNGKQARGRVGIARRGVRPELDQSGGGIAIPEEGWAWNRPRTPRTPRRLDEGEPGAESVTGLTGSSQPGLQTGESQSSAGEPDPATPRRNGVSGGALIPGPVDAPDPVRNPDAHPSSAAAYADVDPRIGPGRKRHNECEYCRDGNVHICDACTRCERQEQRYSDTAGDGP